MSRGVRLAAVIVEWFLRAKLVLFRAMYAATLPFNADARVSETQPKLQRARGSLRLKFKARDLKTIPAELYQDGALKTRLLRRRENASEAVVINTSGGLTGGDEIDILVAAEAEAQVTLSSQACEKIYRSPGDDAFIHTAFKVSSSASIEWLAQPTILFDGACLRRTTTVEVADGGSFLGVEGLVFGRTAMDEQMRSGRIADGWKIRRAGRLVYADTFRVDGNIQTSLDRPFLLGGNRAAATLLYVAQNAEARREAMQAAALHVSGVAGVSAWNGLLVMRMAAGDGYTLVRDLKFILETFRGRALPRTWAI